MSASALALHCARPAAAWALLLPVLLLLLARTLPRPPQVVVGTLELWRGGFAAASRKGRTRPRSQPWVLVCALGLLLGALAWLGPRAARANAQRTWTCLVDRSPSMGFAAGAEHPGTRLDAALESARAWLARASGPEERVRWLALGRAPLELGFDQRPESSWLAPDAHGGEPAWALHDHPGVLWITDREPAAVRAHAGLFASGGAAVPGPIAADGRTTWLWEGRELRALANPRALAVRVQEPRGRALPAVLERVLAAWCGARGFELTRATEAETLLLVELASESGPAEELVLERDGWRAGARGALPEVDGAEFAADAFEEEAALREDAAFGKEFEDWLLARTLTGGLRPVVRVAPGRIQVALREFFEPAGDPAVFALSWARLFDRSARRPAGVVALSERQAAGAPRSVPGELAASSGAAGADGGRTLDAALALAALLCALLAFLLLPRARGVEHAVRRQARRAAPGQQ